MKTTAVCCRHTCGPKLYLKIPWKVIFVNDFMHMFIILCGTQVMTYAEIVLSWFLLKVRLAQLM